MSMHTTCSPSGATLFSFYQGYIRVVKGLLFYNLVIGIIIPIPRDIGIILYELRPKIL